MTLKWLCDLKTGCFEWKHLNYSIFWTAQIVSVLRIKRHLESSLFLDELCEILTFYLSNAINANSEHIQKSIFWWLFKIKMKGRVKSIFLHDRIIGEKYISWTIVAYCVTIREFVFINLDRGLMQDLEIKFQPI